MIGTYAGNHVRWEKDVFADNLTKFSATIQGSAYKVRALLGLTAVGAWVQAWIAGLGCQLQVH